MTQTVATIANAGALGGFPEFPQDFLEQRLVLPRHQLVTVCPVELLGDWGLNARMARYFEASLTADPADFWLKRKDADCAPPPHCRPMHPPEPHGFALYDCRPPG